MSRRGGRRAGAGAKPYLTASDREEIGIECDDCADALAAVSALQMRQHNPTKQIAFKRPKSARRQIIRDVARRYRLSERMVERCWTDWRKARKEGKIHTENESVLAERLQNRLSDADVRRRLHTRIKD